MPKPEQDFIIVYVTCPPEQAAQLARELVTRRLVGCVNIISGVRSIYRWKGEICDDAEALLVLKTREALWPKLRQEVVALHPYDVPEVLAVPVVRGDKAYLQWLAESTRD